ncbi:Hypothetical predicted protein [Scomber scombrus]|uniref:Uncharacterized protein n=1 Tax=Scomber scombrus TaxID=13677 RepID=A0AAV1Q7Z6_SCOSC
MNRLLRFDHCYRCKCLYLWKTRYNTVTPSSGSVGFMKTDEWRKMSEDASCICKYDSKTVSYIPKTKSYNSVTAY